MQHPLSVAILGCWHVHAVDYAQAIARNPATELAAVWDSDPARGRAFAAEHGTEYVASLDDILASPQIDAVSITTATVEHRDVAVAAARAGKHVFTEKMLAPTVRECEEIVAATVDAGVILGVSLPRLYEASTLAACELIDAGRLGELTYSRVRLAHNGATVGWLPRQFFDPAQAVGGAMSDLGCHPLYLTQLFFGARPASVAATYTSVTGRGVEDNAVVTMTYPNGAIGVAETSFVTSPGAFAFELRGTEGALLFGYGGERMLVKGAQFETDDWSEVMIPSIGTDPFDRWVEHVHTGTRDTENERAAVELTRIVVAANEAARTGERVFV